ncbi:MAG: hypothetical protein PF637_11770 [Spirochaetes bacterium]|jgi:tetratricopeptide (TPR) repeat protein|nr:hypothetical protein [Spirochaetota bacterium]
MLNKIICKISRGLINKGYYWSGLLFSKFMIKDFSKVNYQNAYKVIIDFLINPTTSHDTFVKFIYSLSEYKLSRLALVFDNRSLRSYIEQKYSCVSKYSMLLSIYRLRNEDFFSAIKCFNSVSPSDYSTTYLTRMVVAFQEITDFQKSTELLSYIERNDDADIRLLTAKNSLMQGFLDDAYFKAKEVLDEDPYNAQAITLCLRTNKVNKNDIIEYVIKKIDNNVEMTKEQILNKAKIYILFDLLFEAEQELITLCSKGRWYFVGEVRDLIIKMYIPLRCYNSVIYWSDCNSLPYIHSIDIMINRIECFLHLGKPGLAKNEIDNFDNMLKAIIKTRYVYPAQTKKPQLAKLLEITYLHLGEFELGFAARLNRPSCQELKKYFEIKTVDIGFDTAKFFKKSILIIGSGGVADQVLHFSIIHDLLKLKPQKIYFSCDPRVEVILKKTSFAKNVIFICVKHNLTDLPVENSISDRDRVLSNKLRTICNNSVWDIMHQVDYIFESYELRFLFRKRKEDFVFREPYLNNDYSAKSISKNNKINVGISWRSMLMTATRAGSYTKIIDWLNLLTDKRFNWYFMQIAPTDEELNLAKSFGMHFPEADIKNDLDGLITFSQKNLDFIIGPSSATTILAAFGGVRALMVFPSFHSKWRVHEDGNDIFLRTLTPVFPLYPGDISSLTSNVHSQLYKMIE